MRRGVGGGERGGPPVDLAIHGTFDEVPKEKQLAAYRIVQEALRNASLHAAATEVSLSLRRTPGLLELEVVDNGVGFDREAPGWTPGLGLASMEERARLLGGSLVVDSKPGLGTRLRLVLPLEGPGEEAANPAGR